MSSKQILNLTIKSQENFLRETLTTSRQQQGNNGKINLLTKQPPSTSHHRMTQLIITDLRSLTMGQYSPEQLEVTTQPNSI